MKTWAPLKSNVEARKKDYVLKNLAKLEKQKEELIRQAEELELKGIPARPERQEALEIQNSINKYTK